jgi:sialidase-1
LKIHLRVSRDEARTWSEPIVVTDRSGYHVMNNDRVRRLRSGRLLCPVAFTEHGTKVNHYRSRCFVSDDGGATWRAGKGEADVGKRGAMEPEVIEQRDGGLLMLMRTQFGRNYAARSTDGGETWDKPVPFGPAAPEAPSTLRRIPSTGDWLLIFNDSVDPDHHHHGERTPLTAAVSRDEGKTWTHRRNLESDPESTYAYTSLIFVDDRALMSYYVTKKGSSRLSLRFRSVPIAWFSAATP